MPRIGTITVVTPTAERINSEYAAWWTDVLVQPGTYELFQSDKPYGRIGAKMAAIITSESNAPHLAGVAVGPSSQHRVGSHVDYHWGVRDYELADQILHHGGPNAPGSPYRILVELPAHPVCLHSMRLMTCAEAMGFGYHQDEAGHYIPVHEHDHQWHSARTGAEREAAYAAVLACPQTKQVPNHTHGWAF
jgi:hypothetical protein